MSWHCRATCFAKNVVRDLGPFPQLKFVEGFADVANGAAGAAILARTGS